MTKARRGGKEGRGRWGRALRDAVAVRMARLDSNKVRLGDVFCGGSWEREVLTRFLSVVVRATYDQPGVFQVEWDGYDGAGDGEDYLCCSSM